jgi:patatin-like phospholipase/acyl hydrolase
VVLPNKELRRADGGGVRGLFTAIVLEKVMEEVRILDGLDIIPRPCEYFDLIGGTSTGGYGYSALVFKSHD